jgi:hypothetical protein
VLSGTLSVRIAGTLYMRFSGTLWMRICSRISIDLKDRSCYPVSSFKTQYTEPIKLKNGPFIFPVKPDTFNRLYVVIDDIVVFNEEIYISTEKTILEIK